MYAFATAFICPDDEVIIFEPFFDQVCLPSLPPPVPLLTPLPPAQYVPQITFNGGKPVYVPIRAPAAASTSNVDASEWKIDLEELKKAVTPKTKMIWVRCAFDLSFRSLADSSLRLCSSTPLKFALFASSPLDLDVDLPSFAEPHRQSLRRRRAPSDR